jgi:UDP-2,3-diacylglucosamine hydrolase
MNGEIYLIGDSHIGLGEGDHLEMVAWLERLRERKPKALYLNGDLFHYYIGDPKFVTSSVERVFAKMKELTAAGIEIHYVEGNRDFFLENSVADRSVTSVTTAGVFQAGERRFLVVHGDMINDRDWPYRFWRRLSKNPLTRIGVKLIPKKIARKFVESVEAKLARSNFKHKTRLPTELMEKFGRERAADGFDHVVFGHFHHKLVLPAGEGLVTVLPAWFAGGEALVVNPESGEWRFETV